MTMRHAAVTLATLLVASPLVGAGAAQDRTPPTRAATVLIDLAENSLSGEDIRTLDGYRTVEFVRLDDLIADYQVEGLQDVLAATEDGFAEVQVAIRANEVLETAFAENDVDIGHAIAVTGEEGGDLIVYLDEPTIRR